MEIASNKRIVKNTFFLYIRMLFVLGISLYTSRLVLDALGIDDFGLYGVIGGMVALFTIVNGALSAGSSRFLVFELGRGDFAALRKTFSVSFTIHTFIAISVFFFAETIGLWYVNSSYLVVPEGRLAAANWVYQFVIISTMLSLTQVPYNATIIAHEKMNIYAWVGITEVVFKLLLVYLLLHLNSVDKLIFYGLLNCLWSVMLQLYFRFYCSHHFSESKLMIVKEKTIYKKMLAFSFWDLMGNFCVIGNSQGINMMINYFFGVAVNAARGVAYQVENAMKLFSNNFMVAVTPQITKLFADGDIKRMLTLAFESSKYSYFLLYIVAIPVFFEADYLLSIWLKVVPDYSALFLRCIIAANMIRAFARPIVTVVHATGNIKWLNLYAGGASIVLTLPLTYLFYRLGYSPEVTFYVIGGVNFLCNILELFVMKKEVHFNILKYIVQIYGIALIVSLLSIIPTYFVYQLMDISFLRLFSVCITSTVSICILVFFIGINKNDRQKIVNIINQKIQYLHGKR